jgi:hypothetical protein
VWWNVFRKEDNIMSIGRPRDPRKEQQWRQRLARWRRSQLSVTAFCQREGLAPAHFYRWRHRLAARDTHQPAWVPVEVLAEPTALADSVLEVVLARGQRLRVPRGFDPATLRQVLAVLEEPRPC